MSFPAVVGVFVRINIPGSSSHKLPAKIVGSPKAGWLTIDVPALGMSTIDVQENQVTIWKPEPNEKVILIHKDNPALTGRNYKYLKTTPFDGVNPSIHDMLDWLSGTPTRVRAINVRLIPAGFPVEQEPPKEIECVWCEKKSFELCDSEFCVTCRTTHQERIAAGDYDIPYSRECVKKYVKNQIQMKQAAASAAVAASQSSVQHGRPMQAGTCLPYDPGPWDADDVDYLV